jgi:hypothetical protein
VALGEPIGLSELDNSGVEPLLILIGEDVLRLAIQLISGGRHEKAGKAHLATERSKQKPPLEPQGGL